MDYNGGKNIEITRKCKNKWTTPQSNEKTGFLNICSPFYQRGYCENPSFIQFSNKNVIEAKQNSSPSTMQFNELSHNNERNFPHSIHTMSVNRNLFQNNFSRAGEMSKGEPVRRQTFENNYEQFHEIPNLNQFLFSNDSSRRHSYGPVPDVRNVNYSFQVLNATQQMAFSNRQVRKKNEDYSTNSSNSNTSSERKISTKGTSKRGSNEEKDGKIKMKEYAKVDPELINHSKLIKLNNYIKNLSHLLKRQTQMPTGWNVQPSEAFSPLSQKHCNSNISTANYYKNILIPGGRTMKNSNESFINYNSSPFGFSNFNSREMKINDVMTKKIQCSMQLDKENFAKKVRKNFDSSFFSTHAHVMNQCTDSSTCKMASFLNPSLFSNSQPGEHKKKSEILLIVNIRLSTGIYQLEITKKDNESILNLIGAFCKKHELSEKLIQPISISILNALETINMVFKSSMDCKSIISLSKLLRENNHANDNANHNHESNSCDETLECEEEESILDDSYQSLNNTV